MNDFQKIGVLGCGTMGSGIAQVFAASGRDVIVVERTEERLAAGLEAVSRFVDGAIARGKATEDDKASLMSRIRGTVTSADLSGVDLVVESATEDAEVKKAALSDVAAVVGDHVPVVTNTSAMSVTELAAAVPNPARVAGLHFFNPAPVMRTVEVVTGLQTGEELVHRLVALVETLQDKVPVVVDDRPGFLLNALLMPYLNDVIQEYDDGLATAEDIDVALKLGLGYRTGPLEMLDMIGLDVHLRATEIAYAATRDDRYAPPPLLRRMVAAGRLGTKNGQGFRTRGGSPS